jgi:hypothetical protein
LSKGVLVLLTPLVQDILHHIFRYLLPHTPISCWTIFYPRGIAGCIFIAEVWAWGPNFSFALAVWTALDFLGLVAHLGYFLGLY